MVSIPIEAMETPYTEDEAPRLRTAPVSLPTEEESAFQLVADKKLTPSKRGQFVTKHASRIVTTFHAMRELDTTAERRHAQALLVGRMFSELGMFGTPPPKEVPEAFVTAAQAPPSEEDGRRIGRLISDYEEHPAIMAIDTAIDRLTDAGERLDAIQMLRGAAILIHHSYDEIPRERIEQ